MSSPLSLTLTLPSDQLTSTAEPLPSQLLVSQPQLLASQLLKPSAVEEKKASSTTLPPFKELIDAYSKKSSPYPFLEHVDYFRDEHGISSSSIACKWSAATKENKFKTYAKGLLTITAANNAAKAAAASSAGGSGKCPWRMTFAGGGEEIMPLLKHPCDTGVVNADGSINLATLETMMMALFEYQSDTKQWVVRRSRMDIYLSQCAERDHLLPTRSAALMPAWTTVAQAEWNDAFNIYVDYWVLSSASSTARQWEAAITADTFLRFYFQGKQLYKSVLANELPVAKPL